MERYDPEDWLGIMIGAKLFFDFSRAGRKQQAALEGLCREINNIKSGKQSCEYPWISSHWPLGDAGLPESFKEKKKVFKKARFLGEKFKRVIKNIF